MVNKRAFLLFEIVLTIAVLSLGLVFVVRSIGMSMKVAKTTSHYNRGINLAYEKMFDLELESQMTGVELISKEGVDLQNKLFSWRYKVEKLDDSSLGLVLLDITWKESQGESGLKVTSYVKVKE